MRIFPLLKRYPVSAASPSSSRKAERGAKASRDQSRWQRRQLQTGGLAISAPTSNATAPH